LQRYAGDVQIDLDRAGETAGNEFVNALLDQHPNRLGEGFRAALFQQTEGHPLFTAELLRGLRERGDLVQDAEGYWVEGARVDWETLPARVEGVIAERIGRPDEALQETLAIASVEGELFTAEVLALIQGVQSRVMMQRLSEELDRRHQLIRAVSAGQAQGRRLSRYRFRHFLFQKYLYGRLDPVARSYLHEYLGDALETLYGEQREDFAVPLARHYTEAGRTEKAVLYLLTSAQAAFRLSAHAETIAHCRRGLALLEALPDTSERAQTELSFQLAFATALQAVEGYSTLEGERAYERALDLCRRLDKSSNVSPQLIQALLGLALFHCSKSRLQTAHELGERTFALAERTDDLALRVAAHWLLGAITNFQGDFVTAKRYFEDGAILSKLHHYALDSVFGLDTGLECLIWSSCVAAILGFPDQALERINIELQTALERLSHPLTTASIFSNIAMHHYFCRDADATHRAAQRALALTGQHKFSFWLTGAMVLNGWAVAQLGQPEAGIEQLQQAIVSLRADETELIRTPCHGLLAEALAQVGKIEEGLHHVAEALDLADTTGMTYLQAEHYRLKGELLLAQDMAHEEAAEAAFCQAIAVAQQQEAKLFELRATVSLCRLWQRQGKTAEVHQLLAAIYNWFSEGFTTRDLVEAKALLDSLAT
jgi:tetratricopeptide (TPR) repeat protein